jgi:hypothetical protein
MRASKPAVASPCIVHESHRCLLLVRADVEISRAETAMPTGTEEEARTVSRARARRRPKSPGCRDALFGGLTVDETAVVLKISPVTVKRDWNAATAQRDPFSCCRSQPAAGSFLDPASAS